MKKALPATGVPIAPSSISLRAVWWPPPRNVSGAQPTRRFLLRREVHHLARLGDVDAERLFRMDVLAGIEHGQADVGVGQRHREVDHDLDVVALQQLIDAHRRNAELGAAPLGGFAAHVGDGLDVEDGKALRRLQIGGADNAAADDADADFSHSCSPFVSMRSDATAIP